MCLCPLASAARPPSTSIEVAHVVMLRIVYVQSWRRKAAENSFDRARVSLASLGLRQVDELPILVAVDASYCTPLIGLSRRGSPHYFQAFEIRRVSHNLEIYRIRIVSLGPVLFLPLLMLRLVRRRLASQLDPCGPVGVGLMVSRNEPTKLLVLFLLLSLENIII
mmetsp:Transcript_10661/g.32736  ORF Transcript_10661/g.32736 Transcript_10661/m.32736 type:complete len:165 (+) Transcript_10661:1016-1510(+)